MIKPTKNPNLRTQPTCLRSRLYRLVEPLTIKPNAIANKPKECTPTSSQVPNLFLPKLPCTRIQSMMEMLFVSCVCLFSLLLVPVPADVRNGNLTEQRGMYNASWRKRTLRMAGECIPELRSPPPFIILADFLLKSPYLKRPLKTRRNLRRTSRMYLREGPSQSGIQLRHK